MLRDLLRHPVLIAPGRLAEQSRETIPRTVGSPQPPAPASSSSHPGAVLREDVLPALGMTVSAAAGALGVSRQMLHRILSEAAAMTPEMAVRAGKLRGNGPHVWLAMRQAHDLWRAERDLAEQVARIPTMHAA
jgi:antitoxin HigA-1